MKPDHLAVELRPRSGWEALDLGFRMAREWWKPVWSVWLSVYLPVAAACLFLFPNTLHAILLLWWLKPAFDRAVLHTVSRAVFGEPQGVLATLRALPHWLLPGIVDSLLFSRLSMARSFVLPVAQLERQRFRAARKRQAALGSRMRSVGVWLTVACANFELAAVIGVSALASLLEPGMDLPDQGGSGPGSFWDVINNMGWLDGAYYVTAVSLVEPFYVTAGFALYLNRRAILEGWDIELALRRLDERLRAAASAAPAVLLAAVLACTPGPHVRDARADDTPAKSAKAEIKAVLDSPEFGTYKDVEGWHYIGEETKPKPLPGDMAFWLKLSAWFGSFAEAAAWILLIALLCVALYYLRRYIPELRRVAAPRYRPPDALFGFDLAPESLPGDVAAAAEKLRHEGRWREALSLLYRGALSAMVHRHRIALGPADTEGDCARAVGAALPASAAYFTNLVATWQSVAYAARVPDPALLERLCREWPSHFAAGNAA